MEIAIINGYASFAGYRAQVGGRMVVVAALNAAGISHGDFMARKSWGVTTPDADGWVTEFSTVKVEATAAQVAAALTAAGIDVEWPEAETDYAARCRKLVTDNANVLGLEKALRNFREANRLDPAAMAAVEGM